MALCRDCGNEAGEPAHVRCDACALAMVLRVTTLQRIARDYCDGMRADGETPHDTEVEVALSYGIAMALAAPEWAAAVLSEVECVNGQPLGEIVELMGGEYPRRFPVSAVSA